MYHVDGCSGSPVARVRRDTVTDRTINKRTFVNKYDIYSVNITSLFLFHCYFVLFKVNNDPQNVVVFCSFQVKLFDAKFVRKEHLHRSKLNVMFL